MARDAIRIAEGGIGQTVRLGHADGQCREHLGVRSRALRPLLLDGGPLPITAFARGEDLLAGNDRPGTLGIRERSLYLGQLFVIGLQLAGSVAHLRLCGVDGVAMSGNLRHLRQGYGEQHIDVADRWLQPSSSLTEIGFDAAYLRFQPIKASQGREVSGQRLELIDIGPWVDQPAGKAIPFKGRELPALTFGLLCKRLHLPRKLSALIHQL